MTKTFQFLFVFILIVAGCTSPVELSDKMDWYAFQPKNHYNQKSLIGLESWNNEAAGSHGRIVSQGNRLEYNGEEIKIWGINNTYGDCTPTEDLALKRAKFYQKFGINAVRLHKYADQPAPRGIQSEGSFAQFDEAAFQRMDYFIDALKRHGIFTKLSPTFGVKFGPEDIKNIPFHEEVGTFSEDKKRLRATYGAIYLSEELQDLQIEQTVKVLQHTNTVNGLKYAEDPAIFCVELFNEDAVLWHGANWSLQRYPSLRKRTTNSFSQWLKEKYGDEKNWKEVWGEKAIFTADKDLEKSNLKNIISREKIIGPEIKNESLENGTVIPWYVPWVMDNIMGADQQYPELKGRMLDTAEFLIGLQNDFYDRFISAIRETGFDGEIVASNWQAGSTVGHLLNLHSDYKAGIVDRHNYFGGHIKGFKDLEKFKKGSMLSQPGLGTLSAGFQQVAERPFMLSEWIHVQPNEWYAEGPALLGAYGWGLQGWDVSFMFQNRDDGGFSEKLGGHPWDVSNPTIMGLFPAIARQVRRMDVKESENTHYLHTHIPSLLEGRQSFTGQVQQQHDEKFLSTDKVKPEVLVAEKVAVKFDEAYQPTSEFDISTFSDDKTIISSTKELTWTFPQDTLLKGGYVTINTAATKAFIGFAPGNLKIDLGDGYSIAPNRGFSVVYLTAKEENETLETAKEIVVIAIARARNTGMILNDEENQIVERGESPILLEPVKAKVEVPFAGKLQLLDHDGLIVNSTKDFRNAFGIDGAIDQTPFYLIVK